MDSFSYLRAVKCVGVTGAMWLGEKGNIAALSLMAVPALRLSKANDGVSSTSLVKQWRYIYEAGKSQNPPIAAATAAAFIYLAWSVRRIAPRSQIPLYYGSAAVLTLGIVPFTLMVMSPTNNRLIQHSETMSMEGSAAPSRARDDEIDQLIAKWNTLNGVRSLLPLAGGILGLVASLA
ncbi:uncharacterized protein Z518_02110 [Rhinocladiella mackenziei CBS 650.93]|uniref:DUF1772-domain-containing protein n=1 Tax=Rhinocladiella mackenziei CBS 650.93 TaxID=1442369 RepID=A0A0D2FYV5_9EURO|nr:uncharacterized protein Z518_02110 [Rhinocladiella mackenziei CBS 650.93]KIX07457.1 hypothetical protein Z518_02110 [Rhinocladiella mackenziei CBS 650.93]